MPAKRKSSNGGLVVMVGLIFLFFIIQLNFNVRTFRLTQKLQTLTLNMQELEQQLDELECQYYEATRLDVVYAKATNELGMQRPSYHRIFSNTVIDYR